MPLKVKRLWFSCLVLGAVAGASVGLAQENTTQQQQQQSSSGMAAAITPAPTPTKESIAQQRIARARAMIAARSFGSALSELEKIRKENAADEALQQVTRVMMMSVFLEQPDYKRAQDLLEESHKRRNGADDAYFAVAGQVIKSSQVQLDRYKKLGINLSDANLAAELCNDLGKWHALLELIIEQAKASSLKAKQPAEPLALLEAAATARGALARDEYETARWKNELNDTRELMANAQMKVEEVDASVAAPAGTLVASNVPQLSVFKQPDAPKPAVPAPVIESKPATGNQQIATGGQSETVASQAVAEKNTAPEASVKKVDETAPAASNPTPDRTVTENAGETAVAKTETPVEKKAEIKKETVSAENKKDAVNVEKPSAPVAKASNEPMLVGSLIDAATRKVNPAYPAMAKNARVMGVVKVEVVLDEKGDVADVRGANGPQLLQRAAIDAVKRWKFKPFVRDGQPVKASGFVNFNFTL